MTRKIKYGIIALLGLASCTIENDIPYPTVTGSITGFTVEGQRGPEDNESNTSAVIDATARTVTVYVNDSVDISELKITQLAINPSYAELLVDSALCVDPDYFPFSHFASLDSIPVSSNTRIDFSNPVTFTIRTYQDYLWKVTVEQIIKRTVDVYGMTRYILDADSRNVIIYVNESYVPDLTEVQINTLDLGGEFGSVCPDPTTVHDFTTSQTFYAKLSWEDDTWTSWKVFVYQDEDSDTETASGSAFARVTSATITGSCTANASVSMEYKEESATEWLTASDVTVSGTTYTAQLTGLTGSTTYSYRATIDGVTGTESTFTTVGAVTLENGSFENWYQDGKVYYPNASGSSFWGTGNPGAASFVGNLTTPTTDAVSGYAAKLESKDATIKLGAGNIFTGDFTIDGTHGLLTFGRSFSSFPTALRLYYKYTSETINRIGDDSLESLLGLADTCHIYIALSDKSEPYTISTRPSTRQLFDKNDANIIAYGEFLTGNSTSSYQQITIPLEYNATNRTPNYIIIVCAASKYGDYYTGGEGSTLYLDEMELVYE